MLKPANPNLPQDPTAARETAPEAPAGTAQTGDPAAPRAAETAPLHNIADSRSDPNKANRPYAQTVRGQVQRVRLDLLARENERLDRQIQQLCEQQKEQGDKDLLWRQQWETQREQERRALELERQKLEQERRLREAEHKQHARELQSIEQERQLHEREHKQREELEAQLKQLGAQVDRLNTDLIRRAEEVTAAKATPELRDTVKPLLLAVLELLGDSDQVSADAAAALIKVHDTGQSQVNTPGDATMSPRNSDASAAPPSAGERLLGKASTRDPVQKPEQTDADQAVLGTSRPAAESTPWAGPPAKNVAARVPAAAAVRSKLPLLPESLDDDFSAVQEKSSLEDEVAIEIARLLKPQDSEADAETLSLDPKPDEQEAAAKDAPLLLGTSKTPELDAAGTRPPAPSPAAASKAPAAPAAKQGFGGTAAPTEPAKADTPEPDKAAATALVEARGAETRGEDAESAPSAHAPQPVPAEAMEKEPLPKCLTERWDDAEDSGAAGKSNPLDVLRRDKSSFRWPFRRVRSTMEQDQAMAAIEQDESRTPGASTDQKKPGSSKQTFEK